MRFYCTSTGPIGGLNCEVLLYFNWSHRWSQLQGSTVCKYDVFYYSYIHLSSNKPPYKFSGITLPINMYHNNYVHLKVTKYSICYF